jgi:hypothetical protein
VKIHPDILACHAQFGGDLEEMQRQYATGATVGDGSKPAKGLSAVLREWAGNYEEGSFDTEAGLMIEAADLIDEMLTALILLEREMVLSGNAQSKDYGWLPAIEKTRAAIAKAAA